MGDQLKLNYYYGDEPDKFCFYRIPKVLFTKAYFDGLSTDAKVLYGLMLDMMSSSRSNRWVDSENRVFIQFSIQRAMAYLGCGKDKAIKLFAELDTVKGIGLIERIDRGQGKADLIYVKSFEITDEAEDNARIKKLKKKRMDKTFGPSVQKSGAVGCVDNIVDNSIGIVDKDDLRAKHVYYNNMEAVGKTDQSGNSTTANTLEMVGKADQSGNSTTAAMFEAVGKTDQSEKQTPRGRKSRPLEVGNSDPNNTNYNNINFSVNHPVFRYRDDRMTDYSKTFRIAAPGEKGCGHDVKAAYVEILKEQVRYAELVHEKPYCYELDKINGIINIVADLAATPPPGGVEWINSRPYSHEVVKSRLLKMDYDILTYVLKKMNENTTRIYNIRSYLLTVIYNAKDELEMAVSAQVNYDMYGIQKQDGGENGI